MKPSHKKIRIGILGCGAIGSRIAQSVVEELKDLCTLTALYDINEQKAKHLEQAVAGKNITSKSLNELLKNCDLMVEAVTAPNADEFVQQALKARKHVLAMSVGKLLNTPNLFSLAKKNRCALLVPSGAIAGIDAIKAAGLVNIKSITLTTRKPVAGFKNLSFAKEKGIDLSKITGETVIFDGDVDTAVKNFPQNINVAATLALASHAKDKIRIRIVTSPEYTVNIHEVEVIGDFGRLVTRTENVVCPDNPKTSYLAVLSGIKTLEDFCRGVRVGT